MQLFRNAVLVTNRQPIAFKCRACGVCCKNVRDSIVLEPLDAYRIVRDKQKNGCTDSADDILWNMAELKELSPGFHVFVLRTVNDSGMCGMLRDYRCTIYSVRPHTCRLYPFTAEPCPEEHRIKWYLCTEQPHHFGLGSVTAREWQRKICPMKMRLSGLTNAVYCRSSASCCEVCRKTIFSVPNS